MFSRPSPLAPRAARPESAAWSPAAFDRAGDPTNLFDVGGALGFAQAILDQVHFGVAVVSQESRLVFANQTARRECTRHPMLSIDGGRLVVSHPLHRASYLHALEAARRGHRSLVRLAHDDERHGTPTLLALIPLRHHAPTDEVLVVFGQQGGSKPHAIEFYARSTGLTPTETRVLRALGAGLTPKQIAQQHAVALSTVRTQLGHIRSRTGARSNTDLVRMLGCLPPVMPAGLCAV